MADNEDLLEAPYARYLDLEQIFAAQGDPDRMRHPDEFQFRTVHLVSELWLRLIAVEVGRATAALDAGALLPAHRLLRRSEQVVSLLEDQLGLLETMTPADYHAFRVFLGEASGLQSPGYLEVRRAAKPLWRAYSAALAETGSDLIAVYERHAEPTLAPLHDLAEALLALDSGIGRFRARHLQLARRFLGEDTAGTGGHGVDFLRRSLEHMLFPELWNVRGELAKRTGAKPYVPS